RKYAKRRGARFGDIWGHKMVAGGPPAALSHAGVLDVERAVKRAVAACGSAQVFKIGSRQSRNPRNLIDNVLAIDKAISRTSGGEAEKDVVLPIPIGFVMIALGRNRWSNKIAARTCFGKEQIRRIEARVDIQVQLLNVLGSRQGQVG